MTSENNENEKQITIIRRVSWTGGPCPDGADCPALVATSWGTRLTVGRLVTPEVLATLDLPSGEVAIETPGELWEDGPGRLPQAAAGGMKITAGKLVTDPEVLAMLHLPPGEVAIETPGALQEA